MKRSQWQNAETILYAPPVRRPAILLLLQQVKRVPLKTVPRKDKHLFPLPQKTTEHLSLRLMTGTLEMQCDAAHKAPR